MRSAEQTSVFSRHLTNGQSAHGAVTAINLSSRMRVKGRQLLCSELLRTNVRKVSDTGPCECLDESETSVLRNIANVSKHCTGLALLDPDIAPLLILV